VLPNALLAKLRIGNCNMVRAIETPNGIELRACDPELAKQLELAEVIMRKHHDVLKRLAE